MGMFDEEAWQMAEEAAANEDLMSYYISNHPRRQSIEIGAHEKRITLRKKQPAAR